MAVVRRRQAEVEGALRRQAAAAVAAVRQPSTQGAGAEAGVAAHQGSPVEVGTSHAVAVGLGTPEGVDTAERLLRAAALACSPRAAEVEGRWMAAAAVSKKGEAAASRALVAASRALVAAWRAAAATRHRGQPTAAGGLHAPACRCRYHPLTRAAPMAAPAHSRAAADHRPRPHRRRARP